MLIERNTEDLQNKIKEFRINLLNLMSIETLYNRYQNEEIEEEDIFNFRKEKWKLSYQYLNG